jgi:hypothetical protein
MDKMPLGSKLALMNIPVKRERFRINKSAMTYRRL